MVRPVPVATCRAPGRSQWPVTWPARLTRSSPGAENRATYRLPSLPTVIPTGPPGRGYSVRFPAVVIRPILLPNSSVNHSAPSGPATIRLGNAPGASGYSVNAPARVIRPTFEADRSTNHSAPSLPRARPSGVAAGVSTGNWATCPVAGSSRAIALAPCSVMYRLPSGAATIPCGSADGDGSGNSVIVPSGAIWPILPANRSANHTLPESSAVTQPGLAPAVGTG